jgi:hypothetical protein
MSGENPQSPINRGTPELPAIPPSDKRPLIVGRSRPLTVDQLPPEAQADMLGTVRGKLPAGTPEKTVIDVANQLYVDSHQEAEEETKRRAKPARDRNDRELRKRTQRELDQLRKDEERAAKALLDARNTGSITTLIGASKRDLVKIAQQLNKAGLSPKAAIAEARRIDGLTPKDGKVVKNPLYVAGKIGVSSESELARTLADLDRLKGDPVALNAYIIRNGRGKKADGSKLDGLQAPTDYGAEINRLLSQQIPDNGPFSQKVRINNRGGRFQKPSDSRSKNNPNDFTALPLPPIDDSGIRDRIRRPGRGGIHIHQPPQHYHEPRITENRNGLSPAEMAWAIKKAFSEHEASRNNSGGGGSRRPYISSGGDSKTDNSRFGVQGRDSSGGEIDWTPLDDDTPPLYYEEEPERDFSYPMIGLGGVIPYEDGDDTGFFPSFRFLDDIFDGLIGAPFGFGSQISQEPDFEVPSGSGYFDYGFITSGFDALSNQIGDLFGVMGDVLDILEIHDGKLNSLLLGQSQILQSLDSLHIKVDGIYTRLDGIDQKLDTVIEGLTTLTSAFVSLAETVKEGFTRIAQELFDIKNYLRSLNEKMDAMVAAMQQMEANNVARHQELLDAINGIKDRINRLEGRNGNFPTFVPQPEIPLMFFQYGIPIVVVAAMFAQTGRINAGLEQWRQTIITSDQITNEWQTLEAKRLNEAMKKSEAWLTNAIANRELYGQYHNYIQKLNAKSAELTHEKYLLSIEQVAGIVMAITLISGGLLLLKNRNTNKGFRVSEGLSVGVKLLIMLFTASIMYNPMIGKRISIIDTQIKALGTEISEITSLQKQTEGFAPVIDPAPKQITQNNGSNGRAKPVIRFANPDTQIRFDAYMAALSKFYKTDAGGLTSELTATAIKGTDFKNIITSLRDKSAIIAQMSDSQFWYILPFLAAVYLGSMVASLGLKYDDENMDFVTRRLDFPISKHLDQLKIQTQIFLDVAKSWTASFEAQKIASFANTSIHSFEGILPSLAINFVGLPGYRNNVLSDLLFSSETPRRDAQILIGGSTTQFSLATEKGNASDEDLALAENWSEQMDIYLGKTSEDTMIKILGDLTQEAIISMCNTLTISSINDRDTILRWIFSQLHSTNDQSVDIALSNMKLSTWYLNSSGPVALESLKTGGAYLTTIFTQTEAAYLNFKRFAEPVVRARMSKIYEVLTTGDLRLARETIYTPNTRDPIAEITRQFDIRYPGISNGGITRNGILNRQRGKLYTYIMDWLAESGINVSGGVRDKIVHLTQKSPLSLITSLRKISEIVTPNQRELFEIFYEYILSQRLVHLGDSADIESYHDTVKDSQYGELYRLAQGLEIPNAQGWLELRSRIAHSEIDIGLFLDQTLKDMSPLGQSGLEKPNCQIGRTLEGLIRYNPIDMPSRTVENIYTLRMEIYNDFIILSKYIFASAGENWIEYLRKNGLSWISGDFNGSNVGLKSIKLAELKPIQIQNEPGQTIVISVDQQLDELARKWGCGRVTRAGDNSQITVPQLIDRNGRIVSVISVAAQIDRIISNWGYPEIKSRFDIKMMLNQDTSRVFQLIISKLIFENRYLGFLKILTGLRIDYGKQILAKAQVDIAKQVANQMVEDRQRFIQETQTDLSLTAWTTLLFGQILPSQPENVPVDRFDVKSAISMVLKVSKIDLFGKKEVSSIKIDALVNGLYSALQILRSNCVFELQKKWSNDDQFKEIIQLQQLLPSGLGRIKWIEFLDTNYQALISAFDTQYRYKGIQVTKNYSISVPFDNRPAVSTTQNVPLQKLRRLDIENRTLIPARMFIGSGEYYTTELDRTSKILGDGRFVFSSANFSDYFDIIHRAEVIRLYKLPNRNQPIGVSLVGSTLRIYRYCVDEKNNHTLLEDCRVNMSFSPWNNYQSDLMKLAEYCEIFFDTKGTALRARIQSLCYGNSEFGLLRNNSSRKFEITTKRIGATIKRWQVKRLGFLDFVTESQFTTKFRKFALKIPLTRDLYIKVADIIRSRIENYSTLCPNTDTLNTAVEINRIVTSIMTNSFINRLLEDVDLITIFGTINYDSVEFTQLVQEYVKMLVEMHPAFQTIIKSDANYQRFTPPFKVDIQPIKSKKPVLGSRLDPTEALRQLAQDNQPTPTTATDQLAFDFDDLGASQDTGSTQYMDGTDYWA